MKLPTASALDLARTCLGSALLPKVDEVLNQLTAGTVKHRFLQRCNEVGRPVALAEITDPRQRWVCEAIDLDGLPLDPAAYAPEVAFAWNVMTGEARELGRGLERDYSAAEADELVGTADVVALVGDDAVFAGDWKGEWDAIPGPERNLQLRFLGLAAARAYGRDRAIIEIIRPGEERAWRERAELGMWDLAGVAEELRELVRAIHRSAASEQLELAAGAHCKRCRAIRFCPAHMGLIRELAAGDALLRKFEDGLTPASAAAAYHKLEAITALTEKLWAALEGYATHTPIRVDEERVWGMVQRRYESVAGPIGWKVLEQRYGADVAWAASKLEITKAALERLAEQKLVKETGKKKTHIVKELLAAIDQAGGLKVKVQDELRVHKPKENR